MTTDQLVGFFESNDFSVYLDKEEDVVRAYLGTWTKSKINIVIDLNPFCISSFKEYVDNFDVVEEVELYRQDKHYTANFSLSQSLDDFENFQERLKETLAELLNKQ